MPALSRCVLGCFALSVLLSAFSSAQDLHYKKSISVAGNSVSNSEVWVKGARERTVSTTPAGSMTTLRQCDLKRTLTINDQSQSYLVANDPQDESAAKAAALFGTPAPAPSSGGTITQTVTLTDTGERKLMSGYTARRMKTTVVVDSSANSCSQLKQKFEIDGWYADLPKEALSCGQSLPPIRQGENCTDRVVVHHKGMGKPGFALAETITMVNDDASTTKIDVRSSDISKSTLGAELFDIPASYHEVKSIAELMGMPQMAAQGQMSAPGAQSQFRSMSGTAAQNGAMGQMQQMASLQQGMTMNNQFQSGMAGMPNASMQGQSGAAIPLPQALGPKAPGRLRIGIAPAQAQLGQGNNAQADYSTPIRNAIVYMMAGPAVEIAALDSRIPIQLQAEAQQKQCDYILLSSVTVRHGGGGFGKFMKAGSMASSITPVGMMAHSVGAMAASQAAAQAAAMTAQQQAMNQLSQFNGQIKSKDDVTVDYQLYPTGQAQPKLQSSLKGKAKSDGEDVLTPLIQQTANSVLTEVTKK